MQISTRSQSQSEEKENVFPPLIRYTSPDPSFPHNVERISISGESSGVPFSWRKSRGQEIYTTAAFPFQMQNMMLVKCHNLSLPLSTIFKDKNRSMLSDSGLLLSI
jgi:hypothetical protein